MPVPHLEPLNFPQHISAAPLSRCCKELGAQGSLAYANIRFALLVQLHLPVKRLTGLSRSLVGFASYRA